MKVELSIVSGLPTRTAQLGLPTVIGRADDADLILRHPEVSRRHCRVTSDGKNCFIEDLGTSSGTVVNGIKISQATQLRPDDKIQVGPVTVAFNSRTDRASTTLEALSSEAVVLFRGVPAETIPLGERVIFGRASDATVQLNDPMVSRRHAAVEKEAGDYRVVDLESRSGVFINGRRSFAHRLVIGDQIQVGPFYFRFDGRSLEWLHRLSVGRLVALDLEKDGASGPMLEKLSFVAEPGRFLGIIGPSGAGKSTLLNALSGLQPADSGRVLIDGTDYYRHLHALRSKVGHVPQDDIVHPELTVGQALTFAARLRLPAGTPRSQIRLLVQHTIGMLGLSDREQFRISQLSGGQRKRVNVGVELLSRPLLLFLDEPTSGLDPFSEFKMMELLRKLADAGCTVICTTHVMENVFLMDQLAVLLKGRLIFHGSPESARTMFGVDRMSGLFYMIQDLEPAHLPFSAPGSPLLTPDDTKEIKDPPSKRRASWALPILLQRLSAVFRADPKNIVIALGQPLVVGGVVIWVTRDAPLVQFFVYLGTLWFGCSNSAQEIVKELPIYRRERLVGLSRASYLLSKFLWMGTLTCLQAFLLFAICAFAESGSKGDWRLQGVALLFLAYAATGIGLTISTVARSAIQALMLVPLFLIPQILMSGRTVEVKAMSEPVKLVSRVMPSFAAEAIDDVSFFLNQEVPSEWTDGLFISYHNLNELYKVWGYNKLPSHHTLKQDNRPLSPVWVALLILAGWVLACFCVSYVALIRKERP